MTTYNYNTVLMSVTQLELIFVQSPRIPIEIWGILLNWLGPSAYQYDKCLNMFY